MHLSIDLETLGTNVDSQILSIGLAMFNIKTGEIGETAYFPIALDNDEPVNATTGTIKFWCDQAVSNPEALKGLLDSYAANKDVYHLGVALRKIASFVRHNEPEGVWANGTKFDLGMLEYQFKKHQSEVPWAYNADCCMRTLRRFAGRIDIPDGDCAHNALSDAIWQAKYISAACNKLGLSE
jgi:hypothetical protein